MLFTTNVIHISKILAMPSVPYRIARSDPCVGGGATFWGVPWVRQIKVSHVSDIIMSAAPHKMVWFEGKILKLPSGQRVLPKSRVLPHNIDDVMMSLLCEVIILHLGVDFPPLATWPLV